VREEGAQRIVKEGGRLPPAAWSRTTKSSARSMLSVTEAPVSAHALPAPPTITCKQQGGGGRARVCRPCAWHCVE